MKNLYAPWRLEYVALDGKEPGCVFCSLPAEKKDKDNLIVRRAKHCFHILNRFPYSPGHLLVVPNAHVAQLEDLSSDAFDELHRELLRAQKTVRAVFKPHGLNIGMNLGKAAGAGVADHLHYHVVPRWNGDTNFMPILADTRVIPQHLCDTHERLALAFAAS